MVGPDPAEKVEHVGAFAGGHDVEGLGQGQQQGRLISSQGGHRPGGLHGGPEESARHSAQEGLGTVIEIRAEQRQGPEGKLVMRLRVASINPPSNGSSPPTW